MVSLGRRSSEYARVRREEGGLKEHRPENRNRERESIRTGKKHVARDSYHGGERTNERGEGSVVQNPKLAVSRGVRAGLRGKKKIGMTEARGPLVKGADGSKKKHKKKKTKTKHIGKYLALRKLVAFF